MPSEDTDFGRLCAAWRSSLHEPGFWARMRRRYFGAEVGLGRTQPAEDAAAPAVPVETGRQPDIIDVTMVWPAGDERAVAAAQALPSLRWDRLYRIQAAPVGDSIELAHLLHDRAPRLLVIDLRLVEQCGIEALRRLRRHLPTCDWLLGWDDPSMHGFERALQCQAHGCVSSHAGAEQLVRALDAVLSGEVWFPRRTLEVLYLSLLDALRRDAEAGAIEVPSGTQSLTAREAQVLALVREGLTNHQIGQRLSISINTVKKHLEHVFEKRGLHGRRQTLG